VSRGGLRELTAAGVQALFRPFDALRTELWASLVLLCAGLLVLLCAARAAMAPAPWDRGLAATPQPDLAAPAPAAPARRQRRR
jgi:hypothetical protein